MRLTIFQSENGDCLLLTGQDGKTILVDGGRKASFTNHVAPAIGTFGNPRIPRKIDLVYVSHYDQDHIGGVLQLMDDMIAWRVYDYQSSVGNRRYRRPRVPRPPQIGALWHNAFEDQVEDNDGEIEDMLASYARILNMDPRVVGTHLASFAGEYNDLVTGVRDGLLLSKRVSPEQLNIPVNADFGGGLIFVDGEPLTVALGGVSLSLLGPFKEDLEKLRDEWNEWLQENQEAVRRIREESRRLSELAPTDEAEPPLRFVAELATEMGRRNLVTTPNLASVMILAEENGKSILFTGDGHYQDVLKGLDSHGRLDSDGRLHLDVLKVQHHGSKNNIDRDFCKSITADHYVFCGNGAHRNPHLDVLDMLIDTRLSMGNSEPLAGKPFTLWFSSSVKMAGTPTRQEHMQEVENLVKRAARRSKRLLRYRFLARGSRQNLNL